MKNRFTLVEMLIVVAVIGILISILLPSLKNARSEAKNVVCKSNTIQYYNLLLTKVQSDYFTGSKNQGWRKRQYEFRHVGRFPDAKLWESYPLTDPGSGYQKEFIQHVSCPEYDVVFSGNLDIYGYINRTSFGGQTGT